MKHFNWLFVVLLFVFESGFGSAIDSINISILTCAPGRDIYSIYGHNAIRIHDVKHGLDLVYNYGTFDFKTKGFILKFMRGKLPYVIDVADFSRFYAEYDYFQRSVTEQVLDLDSLQKSNILTFLDHNMLPENRTYKYDFFMDNCATRLRDIIEQNVPECTYEQNTLTQKTFRDIIKEYQRNLPWTNFGIDLIICSPADKLVTTRQSAFIPDYLANILGDIKCSDAKVHPLVKSKSHILKFNNENSTPNFFLGPIFVFLILLIVEINLLFRHFKGEIHSYVAKYDNLWIFVMAIASLLMLFMWFGTDHIPTKYNWNLVWASPLIPIWWYFKNQNFGQKIGFFLYGLLIISLINAIPGINILPQYFHPAIIMITLILMLKIIRNTNGIIVS